MTAVTVIGSVNLDFVATAATLPAPGETVTGATLARHPGGKGANQALAAQRLGADVKLVARVGADSLADEALSLLYAEGVDLSACAVDEAAATGVALIAVAAGGENQIVVAPGANAAFTPRHLPHTTPGALICQLELPLDTVAAAVAQATGFVCLNLAPAAEMPPQTLARADLIVVNETEAAFYGQALHALPGLIAVTWGARGAGLYRAGQQIAAAAPPPVIAIDTTGAGDAFVGALTVALLEGQAPETALKFACAAGALAATRAGAQPSLPTRAEVDAHLESV
ncbi:MAG: ribokinase [Pseudomonadota bacterium]|uniref:ribokinase n=1 Tax=Phenylobacterium sp. TaxID=1871053 RepID=UPI0025DEFEE2|nr:ribokinase [Phenylobacterium sp.]MBT9471608.1 ribokinase [Phenylobacterium sp.]